MARTAWTIVREPSSARRGNGWRIVRARSAAVAAVVAIGSQGVRVGPDGLRVRVWSGEIPTPCGAGEPDLTVSLRGGRYSAADVRAAVRAASGEDLKVYAWTVFASLNGKPAGYVSGPHRTREIAAEIAADASRRGAPGVRVVRVRVAPEDVAPDGRRFLKPREAVRS